MRVFVGTCMAPLFVIVSHFYDVKKERCMWRLCLSMYVLLSGTKLLSALMTFNIGVLCKMLLRTLEFRQNWLSDGHTVLKDVNKHLYIVSIFSYQFE